MTNNLLKQEKWSDRNTGENRSKVLVAVDRLENLTPRDRDQSAPDTTATTRPAATPTDDEIPF